MIKGRSSDMLEKERERERERDRTKGRDQPYRTGYQVVQNTGVPDLSAARREQLGPAEREPQVFPEP